MSEPEQSLEEETADAQLLPDKGADDAEPLSEERPAQPQPSDELAAAARVDGNFPKCPHCGERLISGATLCLHCNEEVKPQTADEADGALGKFMMVGILAIAILGGIAFLAIDLVSDALSSAKESPAVTAPADPAP